MSSELSRRPKGMHNGVYLVGGSDMTDARTAASTSSASEIWCSSMPGGNQRGRHRPQHPDLGFDAALVSTIVLTHCHIDHVGAGIVKGTDRSSHRHARTRCRACRQRQRMTAAHWYGVRFSPCRWTSRSPAIAETFSFRERSHSLPYPGHTPGSLSVYCDTGSKPPLRAGHTRSFSCRFRGQHVPLAEVHGRTPGTQRRHPLRGPLRHLSAEQKVRAYMGTLCR